MRAPSKTPWVVASFLLAGCGDPPAAGIDAGTVIDAATDAARGDAATQDAAVLDAGADGAVTALDVTLTYRGHTEALERAQFGYARTEGTITGLYFELARGGSAECPSETSPTPDQVVIVDGFSGAEPATRTEADGVRVSFFDFEGTFRDEIAPAPASAARLEVVSIDVAAGTAEATLSATFDEGSVEGTFVAAHCDSFDVDG